MLETVHQATRRYEEWLGGLMPLVQGDLEMKHGRMRLGPFPFMLATFYRWCQLWRAGAGDLARAAPVLAVGDLHIDNFGTWRDAEGRLVWGINDFDETTTLPWTQDLVRLAVSAHLAIRDEHLALRRRAACDAILQGYHDGIDAGGRPFVLEESHGWLRRVATGELRNPTAFWKKMDALEAAGDIDPTAAAAIDEAMPARALPTRHTRRTAGIGSLGRPRFVGIAEWCGGQVAREAKAMAPSAWHWAAGRRAGDAGADAYTKLITRAVRVPDPTVHVVGGWLVRRLAPHCTRIELGELPSGHDEARLLYAMGFETANVHLGTPKAARAVRKELRARKERWLHDSAKGPTRELLRDWNAWRATAGS
jgi:uncharacterized protein (DUF2252 family)